jgi:hypothetical protein
MFKTENFSCCCWWGRIIEVVAIVALIQVSKDMKTCLFSILVCNLALLGIALEEFVVRGPNELHNVAIDTYIEERRKNPEIKDMGDDSPLMKRAREHAVKRLASLREEDLSLMVSELANMWFNLTKRFCHANIQGPV